MSNIRTRLGTIAILLTVGTFTVANGAFGLAVGSAVALTWYRLPSVYAYTIGQFALGAVSPNSVVVLGLLEVGLSAILLEPALRAERPGWQIAALGLVLGFVATVAWQVIDHVQPLWTGVAVFVLCFTGVAYGLHRYERLALGLITESTETHEHAN